MSQNNQINRNWREIFNVIMDKEIGESERLKWFVGVNMTKNGEVRIFIAKVDKTRDYVRNFTVITTDMLDKVIKGLESVKPEVEKAVEEARKRKTLNALKKLGVSLEDLKALIGSQNN